MQTFHFYRFYTIVAPENIRPQSDYRVSVSIHNQSEPVTIKLSIEDEVDTLITKDITLLSDETKLVVLRVEDLTVNNNVKFTAEGVSGIIFKNLTLLNVESKNCSIFIQTDKAIYKPGESIKFRILVLDFNLKPVELEDMVLKVFITVNARLLIHLNWCHWHIIICFTGFRKESHKTMEREKFKYGRLLQWIATFRITSAGWLDNYCWNWWRGNLLNALNLMQIMLQFIWTDEFHVN